ncbi:MAG: iron-containing redox enzyme family protein [Gammaproteobacteria bacterium]
MTNYSHSFDPSFSPVFSGESCAAANAAPIQCRELFYSLMHISEHNEIYPAAYAFLSRLLAETDQTDGGEFVDPGQPDNPGDALISLHVEFNRLRLTRKDLPIFLEQASPIVLTEPSWLQFISQAATSPTLIAADMMTVFLQLTEEEKCLKAYQSLLLSAGLELPDIAGWTFVKQESINESSLEFGLVQTALSHFPRVFFAEILGFTLAYCRPPALFDIFQTSDCPQSLEQFLSIRRRQLSSVIPMVNKVASDYLRIFCEQRPLIWRRIQRGFWLYQRLLKNWHEDLQNQIGAPLSAFHEMKVMLEKKAPAAVGHHRKIKLAGRSLDAWFSESPFDASGLLAELKKSQYIDPENPAGSLLLKLFDFKGPMFGIFNEAEKTLLRKWLVDGHAEIPIEPVPMKRPIKKRPAMTLTGSQPIDYTKLKNRALFYYLVNSDLYPEVAAAARLKVQRVLKSAMLFNKLPFKHFRHQQFENFVDGVYRREIKAYQPIAKPKLSKQAYLWGIEQFAPTILTDGCWLQHINLLRHYSTRSVGTLLFKIYGDETGNGKLEQNHPFIYRQLLQSVDICLPAIDSKSFIDHEGFIDSAFDLPVYLLSISKFPSAFLPELLGLNLAIELSGLGRVYLTLSEELKFWNIDPAIVDLHISIDNIASGHTALAIKAIHLYLDDVSAGLGMDAVHRHWRRIFTGYCSLQSACRVFKFALICRYILKRLADGDRLTTVH